MDKNVVVTGGAGFIGNHIANHHINCDDRVTIIDNFSTSKKLNQRHKSVILELDLCDKYSTSKLENVLDKADIVYHMAGSVGVKYIDNNPKGTLRNSQEINNNLFPLFEKYNNRVIFASTSEVYGDTEEANECDFLKIGPPDTLRWGYACGKLMSEFMLKTYEFPHTIARFFNVAGPGQLSRYGMVLPTFINAAKENKDIIIYGDGKQCRTFCDIRDTINMLKILTDDIHAGEIYNIGNTNNLITISDLAKLVISITSSKSKITYRQYNSDFSDQFGEIYKRKPNTDKMNQYYQPRHNIEDIINNML